MLQVAFSRTGDVFVADGYCNARVMQYAAEGTFVRHYALAEVRQTAVMVPLRVLH